MPDTFIPKTWFTGSGGGTPITADELNRIEAGIESADDRLDLVEPVIKLPYLAYDTFNRPDGSIGVSESGQTWEVQLGTFTVSGGKLTSVVSSVAAIDVGTADMDVSAIVTPAATGAPGIAFRVGPTSADRWTLQIDMGNVALVLNRFDTSILNTVGTFTNTFVAGTPYHIRAVCVGDTVRCYLDHTLRIVYNMSVANQTKFGAYTKAGLRYNTTTAGVTWDNFLVSRAVDNGGDTVPLSAQTAAYTLILGDAGKAVEVNSATAVSATVPTNTTVPYPIGTVIEVSQLGAGQVTLIGASGVTLRSASGLKLRAQYSSASLRKRATDEWMVAGDLAV